MTTGLARPERPVPRHPPPARPPAWSSRGTWRERLLAATSEPSLVAYYADRQACGSGPLRFAAQHPLRTAAGLAAVLLLPLLRADLPVAGGPGAEVAAVRSALLQRSFGVPMALTGVAVLPVPAEPAEVVEGRAKQTLRRKIRSSTRRGTTTRLVDDAGERHALLELARSCERNHPDEVYRTVEPDVDDLLDHPLWLVAEDSAGTPLLLAVIPTAGRWAVLRYFRTLGAGPEHSDSRYLGGLNWSSQHLDHGGVRHGHGGLDQEDQRRPRRSTPSVAC